MENTGAICSGIYQLLRGSIYKSKVLFRGTFFPGLDGFEEIQNPDIDIFRM
jgi:hypothetical protein